MPDDRALPAGLAARHGGAVRHRTTVEVDAGSFASATAAAETWGVGALVEHEGRVLLVREGDTWLLPGGAREPGESHVEGAVRETREETGVPVRVVDLAAVSVRTFVHGEESVAVYFATFRATLDGPDVTPSPDRSGRARASTRRRGTARFRRGRSTGTSSSASGTTDDTSVQGAVFLRG